MSEAQQVVVLNQLAHANQLLKSESLRHQQAMNAIYKKQGELLEEWIPVGTVVSGCFAGSAVKGVVVGILFNPKDGNAGIEVKVCRIPDGYTLSVNPFQTNLRRVK